MSQAGIIDVEGSHPQIPTSFVTDSGTAVPIANVLEILGTIVAAHSIPLRTTGSGNTVTIQTQYASAAASSVGTNAGLASFNSAQFTVDANGFVTLSGSAAVETFTVDAATAPGTNPVAPNGSGNITVTGGQVAAGTTTNVIRTNSLAANTYTIQVQRSQAVGVSTVGDNGVSHFNSTFFTVDSNGFVSVSGTGLGQTITGNVGGALSPTGGNWNIFGTSTAAGSTPVQTSGAVSTLTVQVQKSQAIAATDATKVGLAAFNSSFFTVDGNGFVSLTGTGTLDTLTGDSGTATASGNNINVFGNTAPATTGLTFTGAAATLSLGGTLVVSHGGTGATTLTGVLTGNGTSPFTASAITQHDVLVGGASNAITSVSPSTAGFVLTSNGVSVDPSFQAVSASGAITTITGNSGGPEVPLAGNFNILGTGSITVAGSANTETVQLTGLTNHNVLVGAGTATITNVPPSTSGFVLTSNGASADPSFQTVSASGAVTTLTGDSGSATPTAGVIDIFGNTSPAATGLTFTGATNQLTLGGTLVVAHGGTGSTSFNINGPVIASTTTTGALTSVTLTNQQFLVGNTSAAPTAKTWKVNVQTFSASGTYTPTSGMVYCTIECWGGGGQGGSVTAGVNNFTNGGGGQAGGYARKTASAATVGASQTVTIGAAGSGATAPSNGGNGGSTSVGTICVAVGGDGGGGAANGNNATGGANGAAGTGDIQSPGMPGGSAAATVTTATTTLISGYGGSSLVGSGGNAVVNQMGGNPGVGFASGGSGAQANNGSTNGGNGAGGYVVITEFILS
jgi:hypothetical protein